MNGNERAEGIAEAERARAELYETLGLLRDRLDYAKRIDDGIARARQRLRAERREQPLLFGAAVAGVALACGAAVWAIAEKIVRAFD